MGVRRSARRTFPHLETASLGLLFLLVIVLFVLGFGGRFALEQIGFRVGSVPVLLLDLVTLLVLLALAFRFLTNPLIIHFGDMDGETHGSARFATDKETAALTRADSGLLIGRDGKTGKLLRYDGPAHLLTMAPTRTGKGWEPSSPTCSPPTAP
jgi:type IV secretion system protein VirD4